MVWLSTFHCVLAKGRRRHFYVFLSLFLSFFFGKKEKKNVVQVPLPLLPLGPLFLPFCSSSRQQKKLLCISSFFFVVGDLLLLSPLLPSLFFSVPSSFVFSASFFFYHCFSLFLILVRSAFSFFAILLKTCDQRTKKLIIAIRWLSAFA